MRKPINQRGAATSERRLAKSKRGSGRAAVAIGLLLLAGAAGLWVLVPRELAADQPTQVSAPSPENSASASPASSQTAFGQFPPVTAAEAELAKLLQGKDETIDLALANWLVATDVPQFSGLTREAYLAQLDEMVGHVRREMTRMEGVARSRGENPDAPRTRCAIFCNAVLKLRFAYAEEFRQNHLTPAQRKALYGDANHVLLAGLLQTRRGTCVSMPLLYLVIGQRLGYPVHLVAIGSHYFIRWEEPDLRMNIETTSVDRVWIAEDDDAYLEQEGMTRDQLQGSDLRNLTRHEVVGQLFFARSGHWMFRPEKSRSQAWMDLSRARHLAADDSAIRQSYETVFSHYGLGPDDTLATLKQKELKGTAP